MVATCIKKIISTVCFSRLCGFKGHDYFIFSSFALECESSEHLLFLFSMVVMFGCAGSGQLTLSLRKGPYDR